MATKHLQLRLVVPIEGHDLLDRTEPLVAGLLKREPALAGLYGIGAGNRGIQAALVASGRAQHVVWVCHELTPYARLSGERVLPEQERIRIDICLKDNLP
jgi:LacI family transcriptional regulator